MKKKLLISFSGGETSAFMTKWLLENKQDEYEMIVVFSNTGCENEETLQFVKQCDEKFNFKTIWIECVTNPEYRKGVSFKIVDFNSASRNGEPFAAMIAKHGIPNIEFPHCSRELKRYTIKSYLRSLKWKNYFTAIGIRHDELHRQSKRMIKDKIIYPLIIDIPMSKTMINFYWSQQSFRLQLKGYQGNCKWCWKKSLRKLLTIASETPQAFDFVKQMENEFENFIPVTRIKSKVKPPIRFYTNYLSAQEIIEKSKQPFRKAENEASVNYLHPELDFSVEALNKITEEDFLLDKGGGKDKYNMCSESCEAF